MSNQELLAKMGTDAAIWANEYMDRFGKELPDEGNMIGWFANAIEAGRGLDVNPDYEAVLQLFLRIEANAYGQRLAVIMDDVTEVVNAALALDPPEET